MVVKGLYPRMLTPVKSVYKIPTPGNRHFDRSLSKLHQSIDEVIAAYRVTGTDHSDALSALLDHHDEKTGDRLNDAEVHDEVLGILVGAVETTPALLAWTFYLLSEYPEAAARVREEAKSLLAGKPAEPDHIAHLKYTRRVLTEALRMYPPVWIVSRVTTTDVELAGKILPPGTAVMWSPYILHRNPRLFPEPERFDPDRWLPGASPAPPRNAMIPFGGGSHRCPGETFGLNEATLVLATVTRLWKLHAASGAILRPLAKMTLSPGRIPMVKLPITQP
ncbi:cytochrome P450 [Streptomyces stramineus]